MSDSMDHIEPELQSLLAEIAVDGESSLFRTSVSQRKRLLYPPDREVRATSAQISRAERHLLKVHREEVAQLLYKSAQRLILDDPAFGMHINTTDTVDRDLRLPDPEDWKRRAEASSARHKDAEGSLRVGQDLIDRLCAGSGRATPRELLEACMRLLPADRVRVTLAVDDLRTGADAQAEAILMQVLSDEPSSVIRSHAWHNLGLRENRRQAYAKAVLAYEASANADEDRVSPLLSMFLVAVQAGRLDDVVRAGTRLDNSISPTHRIVRADTERWRAGRRSGKWSLTSAARKIIDTAGDKLGDVGYEVVKHAFEED